MSVKFKAGIITLCVLLWAALASAKQPHVVGDRLNFELPDLQGESISSSDDLFHQKVLWSLCGGPGVLPA